MQADFGPAAVCKLIVLAEVATPVKPRRSKGVGQRAGQGIAKVTILA
nr:hypothetical protein [Thiopseudomonas denitrificans]